MRSIVPNGVYGILDLPSKCGLAPAEVIESMACGGCRVIQLRAKNQSTAQRIEWLRQIAPRCHALGLDLWVNDDVDAACCKIPGVVGVHLGQDDLRGRNPLTLRKQLSECELGLGISTHNKTQVLEAHGFRPEYLGFGPIFKTASKRNPDPVTGVAKLLEVCELSSIPIVAIGGISLENIHECKSAGAQGVAVISALEADSVAEVFCRSRLLSKAWRQGGPVS